MTRNDRGFSLVEALVALAIIAALAGALAETIGAHARMRAAMAQRHMALLVAQSALARVSAGDPVEGGQAGDLFWHVVREPYDAGGAIGAGQGFAVVAPLEHVGVAVEDGAHHPVVTLRTVRIMQ
jgi:prepilin-type N-terminal cleavage/methylation domain-containing protein